jgi:hypothetical protein
MHTTTQILDAIAEKHGGATDYRLSKLFETSTSVVTSWRKGRATLSTAFAHRAAALLEWDPAYVVACMEHERAERLESTDEIRATWEKIAQAFKPAAAVILAALALWASPAPSEAYSGSRAPVGMDDLYIMRSGRRSRLARLLGLLRAFREQVRERFRPYGTDIPI